MFNLVVSDIQKSFSRRQVLCGVTREFKGGTIHVLLGENGAGKSTLAQIMAGRIQADFGTILINGKKVRFNSRSMAVKHGIAMVDQQPLLSPHFTVWENIVLGNETGSIFPFINKKHSLARVQALADNVGFSLNLLEKASRLTASQKLYTALLSALYKNPQCLILDEPYLNLDQQQRKNFFSVLKYYAGQGKCIILITHNIREAVERANCLTVLHRGRVAMQTESRQNRYLLKKIERAVFQDSQTIEQAAIAQKQHKKKTKIIAEKTALQARNITTKPSLISPRLTAPLFGVLLNACYGEITLVSGKKEAGLYTLEDIITGMHKGFYSGTVAINGTDLIPLSPAILRQKGVGIIPSNKTFRASNPQLSICEMLCALTGKPDKEYAINLIQSVDVDVNLNEMTGNVPRDILQKLILARETAQKPKILILAEPMQGLDSTATIEFWKLLENIANAGTAVIVLLSDASFGVHFAQKYYQLNAGMITVVNEISHMR